MNEHELLTPDEIKSLIATVPNHPKPGVMFRDIMPLLSDARGLRSVIGHLAKHYEDAEIDRIVGLEARGFLIATPLAAALGVGLVAARKPGKLPGKVVREKYQLEYGEDELQIESGLIAPGMRVLVADDLLATGGTALAAVELCEKLRAQVVGCGFVVELPDLGGRARLEKMGQEVFSICEFRGE